MAELYSGSGHGMAGFALRFLENLRKLSVGLDLMYSKHLSKAYFFHRLRMQNGLVVK
jgi:hypothetical protein